jgi:hypothetical protein
MTVHGPNAREHHIGQNPTRPECAWTPPWTRQCIASPGRCRAPPSLSLRMRLPHLTRTPTDTAIGPHRRRRRRHHQALPRRYREDSDDAACSCPPLAKPSSALALPSRRLPPAPMPLPLRVLDRRRHRRPAAPPRPPLRPINSNPLSLPFPHQTCSTPSSEPPQRQLPFD